ncbi:C40 family peptidase [Thorsellia anophelis]|uniref:Probable lipoprotein NlpC n=1 Tax=Thorsellia anophelis DSM 18579 TaxID=1123402 RepID=A0A1I0EAL8_9GAMM|nr:NlpC/P60 family protein [Thorsellia anophelis]SET42181.1 probable lipoprotein NlpC [Thorsellia anophelis DSM 18579]
MAISLTPNSVFSISPFKRGLFLRYLSILLVCLLTACSSKQTPVVKEGPIAKALSNHLNEWKGTPYRYGGTTKKGIDCSAFVQIAFRDVFRKNLPRSTTDQSKLGKKINPKEHRAGDLIFFRTDGSKSVNHVGIYAENNTFIHASTSKGVTRSNLSNEYWKKNYLYSRRVLN